MDWSRIAAKLYRVFLLAYPAEFRHEYAGEMVRLFEDRLRTEAQLRLWLEVIADISITALQEHCHILAADLRYGFRMLAKSPGFALTAGLMLAVGIGASTAVFSVVDGTLLRPLPYSDPQRLIVICLASILTTCATPVCIYPQQATQATLPGNASTSRFKRHLTGCLRVTKRASLPKFQYMAEA
jgi:hypothetical protein